MTQTNRQWVLKSRPEGMPRRDDFELREQPVPAVTDGHFLVRNLYLSCDPTQRGWMERDTYAPAVAIGDVMRAVSAARVVVSKHPGYREGDLVCGAFGWQDYALSDGSGLFPIFKLPSGTAAPTGLSLFGITGLSAYFGMLDIGAPQAGDGVLVSAAAGSTGSIAAQIAKIRGARVVGIAGGARKCQWLTEEIGLAAAIDYRSENVRGRIVELLPKGCDVYFDNVGGDILEAALGRLARHARVVLCGAISTYNDREAATGPRNYVNLILRSATMRGFLVFDYAARIPEAVADLGRWAAEGKLKDQIDVAEGFESAPDALRRLFTGENLGKQIVHVAD
ncbi:MAG: NADP-dependent oxidoreductase [Deltaproteobacteria bacterium]|nr:NADP-dependent oxidoreductase [Deltaproteobacteria bacterium]